MEPLTDVTAYLWGRLPLILLFVCGYLVYQLMAATRITDGFVAWALRRSKGHPRRVLFYIIAASAALSSFIPNTITVLTLIPVLKRLDRDFAARGVTGMTTVLMCSAIYGAAIGGMGSMIGSPANAVLFAALDLFEVAGRDNLNFFNWFLWSVPLVAAFVFVAWFVAAGLGLPRSARGAVIDVSGPVRSGADARQRYGARLFWLYMGYFVIEAVARENVAGFAAVSPVVSMGFAGLFLYLLFVRGAPAGGGRSGPLLTGRGLLKSVPRRGLIFILALAGLVGVVHWTGLDHRTVVLAGRLLEGDMDPRLLFLLTITAVIFLTEILSNTAVVAAFFTIAFYAAKGHGMDPLPLMIAVGVASTCAFMTPIATTSNALAFGEMKSASLKVMLGLGLALNVLGALLMTGWLSWILPRLY
ncbi:Sodium-dependent dicarboxylate transporter SdcS [Pseudodesulfovibrio hydrargyri]|uniref:Sodium-dependent dicarboxylate transporter SdcS n=1 Tax=Pseudodesulfovibrio hydrargyri TaxID=2125990 RepID=A0A1J5N6L6_9BACT|nr:SLC13 family permease [Pseudodesulfovibrio hydrargyri]OIQ50440.1 Sodium-dependent dicarboxylate transporter SdcS [Pseudodesulfovibrio hydrargyri]